MTPTLRERLAWPRSEWLSGDMAVAARAAVYLLALAAAVGAATIPLPHHPEYDHAGILAVLGAACAMAIVITAIFDQAPAWALHVYAGASTVLVTLAIYFTGDAASAFALFYLFAAMYVCYFTSLAGATAQILFIGLQYALLLIVRDPPNGLERWLLTFGAAIVLGSVVGLLRQRVRLLMARLEDAAKTDPLTGLPNRRAFEEALQVEVERSHRSSTPVTVLVVDIDRFRTVNDRLGHPAGDEALWRFGKVLLGAKRKIDFAARLGGEEFALVVPVSDAARGYAAADQLRAQLRDEFRGYPVPLTISVGIASCPEHGETGADLLRAAGRALEAAKQGGGDRAVIHGTEALGRAAEEDGRRRSQAQAHLATVLALAEALDLRDAGTASHSETVARYCEGMARRLGLPDERIDRVRVAGLLHDVGKIGVPDSILKKEGSLNEDEVVEMRKHPGIGARLLEGGDLDDVREWVLCHHERPDGEGYPRGLRAEEIPVEARIVAVADAYEAMTTDRVYSPALGDRTAQEELRRGAGTIFDERVVEAFLAALDEESRAIARK